jgi:hypothetical protein
MKKFIHHKCHIMHLIMYLLWNTDVSSSHKAVLLLVTKQSTAVFSPGMLWPSSGPVWREPAANQSGAKTQCIKTALFSCQQDPNLQPIQSAQSICKLARYKYRPFASSEQCIQRITHGRTLSTTESPSEEPARSNWQHAALR